ncbi:hypothetical protein D3C85_204460 [compost metagenome]
MPPKIPAELLARISGDVNAFHSNVYAQQAQGGRLGSTSVGSFGDRVELERNRRSVRSYRESAIGAGAAVRHHSAGTLARGSAMPPPRQRGNTPVVPPSPAFREPPSRPYNPYA